MEVPGDNGKKGGEAGQSLLETALVLPFLLVLVFNAINFGWFFYVAQNLAAAPRQGVQYSIQGFLTTSQLNLPPAGPENAALSISYLTYAEVTGALSDAASTPVQVCTKIIGLSDAGTVNQKAQCEQFGAAATFPVPASDPESPFFVLQRVDVQYTVKPLIAAAPFGLQLTPSLTFRRQASMRAMD